MQRATGAVTASSLEAATVGEQILRAGGNAVDAAVAVALASCVVDCCNTGIGGFGGHLIVSAPPQLPACVDFNVWAPLAISLDSYRRVTLGRSTSVIPNVVAGLTAALKTFGSMRWADVIAPAIILAEQGFICGKTLSRALGDVKDATFVGECFEQTTTQQGLTRLRQPALARTLRYLQADGPQWFYEGPIASIGSRSLNDRGIEITPADWAEAQNAISIQPASSLHLDNIGVFSSPLGTSGSICTFATVAAGRAIASSGQESAEIIRQWAQRMAAAWSYRFTSPRGNAIANDGVVAWIDRAHAANEASALAPDAGHTCHLNVADASGMLAAATLTHGKLWFGARWALSDTGVIMNYGGQAMVDAPPVINGQRAYGVTNMSPTIIRLGDGAALAIGSPGARRIASIVGLAVARHVFGGVPLQQALLRGRFHAEARDVATLEPDRLPAATADALRSAFRTVRPERLEDYYGPCTAIRRDSDGALTLGLDDRWPAFGIIVN